MAFKSREYKRKAKIEIKTFANLNQSIFNLMNIELIKQLI